MTGLLRRLDAFAWIALLTVSSMRASAQAGRPAAEHEVKAAYLYQFGRYVEWPHGEAPAGRPFAICVFGDDPFGAALDETVKGKRIAGQPIVVKRSEGPEQLRDCRVVFVSRSANDRLPEILASLDDLPILTVGEGTEFTRGGGMLGFVLAKRRVRFVANLAAAQAANVKISSELLRLAVEIDR